MVFLSEIPDHLSPCNFSALPFGESMNPAAISA